MDARPKHLKSETDTKLYRQLHVLVNAKIKELPHKRIQFLRIKVFIWPLLYFGVYAIALSYSEAFWIYLILFAIVGVLLVVIFAELIHELCHSNIFKKVKYNRWAYYIFDLLGANSYIWKQRHLKLHHRFPNVNGWDADVEQKGPIMIFQNEESKKYQRFQDKYIFFLYPFFALNWLFVRDFKDYFSKDRVIRKSVTIPRMEYIKLFFFKTLYFFQIVLIPYWFTGLTFWQAILGLLVLTTTASLLAMIVLLTPHINDANSFLMPDRKGKIPLTWFRHQIVSTNDTNIDSWFVRTFMGNFNYHLAHHLFPRISSVYAPEVTLLIKEFLHKHKLPYKSYSLSESLKRHYKLIKNNALFVYRTIS
jgi:linoleoyl-CoA desaturase